MRRSGPVSLACMMTLWLLGVLGSLQLIDSGLEGPFELEWLLWPSQREGFATYRQEFPHSDDQIVVISGGDAPQREGVVDQLVARFGPGSAYGVVDIVAVRPTMLYFLTRKQLQDLEVQLIPLARRLRGGSLADWMTRATLSAPVTGLAARLRERYLQELEACLASRGRHTYVSPWLTTLELPEAFWQLFDGRTRTYLTLPPDSHVVMVGQPLRVVRQTLRDLLARNPLMTARVSGTAAILSDQGRSLELEVLKLSGLCLVAMIVASLRGYPMLPLVLALLSVGPSLTATLGLALWALGPAGVAALLAFPMAVVVSACLACVAAYQSSRLRTLRAGLLVAGAFLPLTVLSFPAAAHLSLVLMGAALSSTLALTTLFSGLAPGELRPPRGPLVVPRCSSRPRALLILIAAVALSGLVGSRGLRFEADFVGLLDKDTESLYPEQVLESRGRTGLTAVLTAQTVDQAYRQTERLERCPSVGRVTSVAEYLPPGVADKTEVVARLTPLLGRIQAPRPIPLGSAAELRALAGRLHGFPEVARLQRLLDGMGPGEIQDGLSAFQAGFLHELEQMAQLLRDQRPTPPSLDRIPPALTARMVSARGSLSLMVSPAVPLRSQESLARFVHDLRRVTPSPSGPAVLLAGLAEGYSSAAERGPGLAWCALGILNLGLLVSVRRTVLVMLVPTLALGWTRGLMGWFGVTLNPWNWPVQILVLALGVILCAEVTSRSLPRPVIWPHLLMMGGFLSVGLGHHPALSSLGFVGGVGMAANLLAALTVLPALQCLTSRAPAPARS